MATIMWERRPIGAVPRTRSALLVRMARSGDAVGCVVVHLACLWLPAVGISVRAVAIAAVFYALRCFGVCAGFHRGFSHRAYRMSRPVQVVIALMGTLAMQRGLLWWVA